MSRSPHLLHARYWSRVASALLAATVLLQTVPAAAQYIHPILPQAHDRSNGFRGTQERPYWINRDDCIADDVLSFELRIDSPTDQNLEVWAGSSDCSNEVERESDGGDCWRVWKGAASDFDVTVEIYARDVVEGFARVGTGADVRDKGTEDSCQGAYQESISFYFMYLSDTGDADSNVQIWKEVGVDTKGPTPPTDVRARVSDERLRATWEPSLSQDLLSYNIYCQVNGVVDDAGAASAALGAGGTGGLSGVGGATAGGAGNASVLLDAGDASVVADAGDAAAASTGASMGAGGAGGVPAAAPTSTVVSGAGGIPGLDAGADAGAGASCQTAGLTPGELPSPDLEPCGTETGNMANDGFALKLQNGVEYAIAVAGVDDLGNPGPLSNVACATPAQVNDFYEEYRRFGGQGGGGFCNCALPSSPPTPLVFGGLLALGLFGVRRWQPRRRRRHGKERV